MQTGFDFAMPVSRTEARAAASSGISASLANANNKTGGQWEKAAKLMLRNYLAEIDDDVNFMSLDVRKYAHDEKCLGLPPDPRAWGGIMLNAKREGLIRSVRLVTPAHAHGSYMTLWTKAKE